MGWFEQRTGGIRNSMLAGGVVVAAFIGVVITLNRGSPDARSAFTDAAAPTIASPVPSSSPPPSPPPSPSSAPVTVPLAALAKADEYKGKEICTCGFVRSSSSSPDHGLGGTPRTVLRNVIVSDVADAAPEDTTVATAICTWMAGTAPNVKPQEKVCVQGQYVGPIVKQCSVVPSCP